MKRQFKRLVLVFLTLVVLLTMASCRNIAGKIPFWKAFENLDLILSTSETEEQSTPVETPTQTPEESTPGPEDGTPCDHANTVVEGAVSATCTTDGHTGKTVCSDCGETISEGEVVSKLDHAMGEWEVTKQPTCGDVGTETRTCTRENCAHSETRDVVATGQHEYGAWVEDTPATETTTGTKHRECTVCHNVENGTIPVLGHTHNYTAVVTDPTCTEEGYTLTPVRAMTPTSVIKLMLSVTSTITTAIQPVTTPVVPRLANPSINTVNSLHKRMLLVPHPV